MSIRSIAWAFEQEIFSASQKFVLVALANFSSDTGKSYPQVATISKITGLQCATVRKALRDLTTAGYITDTGRRFGPTQQVKIYQLAEGKDLRKRKSSDPKTYENVSLDASLDFTKESERRLRKDLRKRKSNREPLLFNVSNNKEDRHNAVQIKSKFIKPTVEEVIAFCLSISLSSSDGEAFYWGKEGNGWKNGKNLIKDWRATIRQWKAAGYMPSQKQINNANNVKIAW